MSFSSLLERIISRKSIVSPMVVNDPDGDQIHNELVWEELCLDEFSGLPNRRSYKDAEHRAITVMIDVRQLWDINRQQGRHVGDWALSRVVDAIRRHADTAYHLFADKYVAEFDHLYDAVDFVGRIERDLDGCRLSQVSRNPTMVSGDRIRCWFGVGLTRSAAEAEVRHQKHRERG